MNKQSTAKLSFQPPKKLKTLNLTLHLIFRDKRRKDERFASVIGFLDADYYALSGSVPNGVNKKHGFEDTVEKKLPPFVIDLVNYPFKVINSNPLPTGLHRMTIEE